MITQCVSYIFKEKEKNCNFFGEDKNKSLIKFECYTDKVSTLTFPFNLESSSVKTS